MPTPHCPGQWAVETLWDTASLLGGTGQWNSCCIAGDCSPQKARDMGRGDGMSP